MRKWIWKMIHSKALLHDHYDKIRMPAARFFPGKFTGSCAANQDGSIIIIALMVLVIMTVMGIISSDTVVTENFILRNQGIYKQNVNMVEAAIMESLQQFMQIPFDDTDLANVNDNTSDWYNDISSTWATTDWYATNSSARVLSPATSLDITSSQILAVRGENAGGNLLVSFVGWDVSTYNTGEGPGAIGGSESLVVGPGNVVIKKGRILGEYISQDAGGANNGYGMLRMEIGVMRKIST